MSPLDRELCETLGELVLVKRGGVKAAADKEALFKAIGTGADWLFGKGLRGAKAIAPRPSTLFNWGVRKPYNIAMEAGGIRGISNEAQLLKELQGRGKARAWQIVRDLAKSRGQKNPVTAFSAFFNPMKSLTPRVSEAGYARYILGELKDPVKLRQFLVGATPAQKAAVKRLAPMFGKAQAAGEISLAGQLAPFGIIGAPVAYHLAKGGDEGGRPVVSSPRPGFKMPEPEEPNMLQKFWGGAGDRISKLSPGLGSAISNHPYLSTAAASGLAGAGLYGLFGGSKDQL